jgi:hypothetical protein
MKEEEIKRLLERYWQCETSPEEERDLRLFFSKGDFSEELKPYQPLFIRTNKWSEIKTDTALKKSFIPPVKVQFYPLLRIAASVLILLSVGIGLHTHYQQEKYMDKVFSDTYSDPADAVKKTEQVVAKVSSVLQLIQQENKEEMLDSLQNIDLE